MKKPLASAEYFLCIVKQREKDTEQLKTLEIIITSANFQEILKNYMPFHKTIFQQKSKCFELNELFIRAYEDFETDCCTNAIKLKVIPYNISVYDDGKDISSSRNFFYPYYSESGKKYNSGIGLYLSKCFMHSMNGDLYYKQENGFLTFFISLPVS